MRFRWTKRHTILAIVAIISLCCTGTLLYESAGRRSTHEAYNHVMQSVKPGMSRAEVLEILNKEGAVSISIQEDDVRRSGQASLSLRELVFVLPNWWYLGNVGFFFDYDYSGSLTDFYFYDL